MNEQRPDPTIDLSDSEAALDAGLVAAFGRDSEPLVPVGASVLMALGDLAPRKIHLRDPMGETEPPVHQPGSSEMPLSHDPAGRYRLQGEIARGGMGAVLKGHDVDLGRDLAVKVLLEEHRGKAQLVHRFVEEAQIGGQLQHPGIVPVYELGQFPDQRPYFTMKLVKGQTLAKLLFERKEPGDDRPRLLKIFESVCETIAYAHARGVIHRDLKPSNIMVGAFGEVQVMDWGLAKVLQEGGVADDNRSQSPPDRSVVRTIRGEGSDTPRIAGSQTCAGSVMGTPAYMPPEQAVGDVDRLDERSDVFGLGAILCQMLTGSPPYSGATSDEVYGKAKQADLTECFARLDACGVDRELIQLTQRCLAADPKDRPRNAGVLAAEMARHRESVEQRLRQAELARVEAQARAVEERKRRRVQLALAVSVLVTMLLVGGGAFWLMQDRAVRERETLARRAETERAVGLALGQAEQLRLQASQAEAQTLPAAEQNLALWRQASAALGQAEAAMTAGDADADTRKRVADLRTKLEDGTRKGETACRVARLLANLEEARLARSDPGDSEKVFNNQAAAAAFVRAFSTFGLDVLRLAPEDASAPLRSLEPGPRTAAALGLDYWAACAEDAKTRERLRAVAAAIDEDPWRQRFRQSRDRKSLETLATEAMTRDLPVTSLNLLVDALLEVNATSAALRVLGKATDQYPGDFWTHFRYAEQLRRSEGNRRDTVHQMLGHAWAAVAARPQSSNAYYLLAWCLARAEIPKGATAALRKASELDPKFAAARKRLDAELHKQGSGPADTPWTLAALEKAAERSPRSALLHDNLYMVLRERGDLPGAAAVLRKSITLDPNNATNYLLLSTVLGMLGDRVGSLDAAQTAIELDPQSDSARSNLGRLLREQGNLKEAAAAYQKAIELNPSEPLFHGGLAAVLLDMGDARSAEQEFQKAVALAPKEARLYRERGVSLRKNGNAKGALNAFQKAVELAPDYLPARINLASTLLDLGDQQGSLAAFRMILEAHPKDAYAHRCLADILRETGDMRGAATELRTSIELDPKHPDSYFNLSYVLDREGDIDGSIAAARKTTELAPTFEGGYVNLASGLKKRGDLAGATAAYRKAVELEPDSGFNRVRLAEVLLERGDPDGSLAACREAVELTPSSPEGHQQMGVVLRRLGRFADAEAAFRRAAELYAGIAPSTTTVVERRSVGAKRPSHLQRHFRPDPSESGKAAEAAAECRIAMALECSTPALLAEKAPPKDNAERTLLARTCSSLGQHLKAARLFDEAFRSQSRLPEEIQGIFLTEAGRTALLAGCGEGTDAAQLNDQEQARWRKQAIEWLQADLALWKNYAATSRPEDRRRIWAAMDRLQKNGDVQRTRTPQVMAKMPPEEQDAWKRLWKEVEELLRREDPRIGKWISNEKPGESRGMVFLLSADGSFSLGDIDHGKEYPDAVRGTWKEGQDGNLHLKVEKSENDKTREGDELKVSVAIGKDGREMRAFERVLLKASISCMPSRERVEPKR